MDDVNTALAEYNMEIARSNIFYDVFGEAAPEKDKKPSPAMEQKKKNVFERIGETVIKLFKKFSEMIDKIISHLKEGSFARKSNIQKLELLLKEHPELKKEALGAFNEGAINMSDFKSLKELDAAFDEIVKMSKKEDVDPNSLKGKWEAAKKKIANSNNSWIINGAKAATVVIGAAVAVKTFGPSIAKAQNEFQKNKAENAERNMEYLKILKKEDVINKDTGIATTLLGIHKERLNYHASVAKSTGTAIDKLEFAIASFIDKYTPKNIKDNYNKRNDAMIASYDKRQADKDNAELEKKKRETRELEKVKAQERRKDQTDHLVDDLEREKKIAQARAYGQSHGNHLHNIRYRISKGNLKTTEARAGAYAKKQGENDFERDHTSVQKSINRHNKKNNP
jgi:hypothetical protein